MDPITVYDNTGRLIQVNLNPSILDGVSDSLESYLQNSISGNFVVDEFYITCNGRLVNYDSKPLPGHTYRVNARLLGGKGGFGSMLRTIGAQIEKTTNREAMRDLSGRRLRDVNNEKKLADWVAGAADREREREQKRQERFEKRKAEIEGKRHKFTDNEYLEQKETVINNLDDALSQGLKRQINSADAGPSKKKSKGKQKASFLAGSGLELSDLSSESEDEQFTNEFSEHTVQTSSDSNIQTDESGVSPVETSTTDKSKTEEKMENSNTKTDEQVDESQTKIHSVEDNSPMPPVENKHECSQKTSTESAKLDVELSVISEDTPLDLSQYSSSSELESVGLEKLKKELISRGMKCGGSLTERAQRLYSVRGLTAEQIPSHLLAKKKK